MPDAYLSVVEALKHSGYVNDAAIDLKWVNANDLNADNVDEMLGDADGIIVPGGFGQRGTEGKIEAIRYAREKDVPMLGICLGMQLTCVEFARHVLNMEGANSTELDQILNTQSSTSCVTKSTSKTWVEHFVLDFTHVN